MLSQLTSRLSAKEDPIGEKIDPQIQKPLDAPAKSNDPVTSNTTDQQSTKPKTKNLCTPPADETEKIETKDPNIKNKPEQQATINPEKSVINKAPGETPRIEP